MANYAILDYDGFICKAFYASKSKHSEDNAEYILDKLTDAAIDKAMEYYDGELDKVFYIVSGHSWKKNLYTDYKATRERNPELGDFRDAIIETDSEIIKPSNLEADELCIMLHDNLFANKNSCIIFSDDKDIHYTTLIHCKINLNEKIDFFYDERYIFYQMLAGDKEDNIKGINKVGMKVAEKLMTDKPAEISEVIKIYKEKNISKEDCIKNLNLIIPMNYNFNNNKSSYLKVCNSLLKENKIDKYAINNCIRGQLNFLKTEASKIYGD